MRKCVVILIGLVLLSCESTPEVVDTTIDYFPLKTGTSWLYDVDETQYNQITGDVQSQYELKVTIDDSLHNQEGGYTYILHRQKRKDANAAWENLPTWMARISSRQGIVVEENTAFVKLLFPLGNGIEWNGNSFNTLGGDEICGTDSTPCDVYRLQDFDAPMTVTSGNSFEHTATVVQNDNPDLIVKHDVRKETYARGVGLVYSETTILNYCTTGDCLGKQIVETGVKYKQVIKQYDAL